MNPLYIHICKQVTSKGTGFSMDQYGGSSEFVDEFLAILIHRYQARHTRTADY